MNFHDHIRLPPSSTLTSPRHSSPISELPIEIITQVFLFANPAYKLFQHPSPGVPPLQLCHVCHDWREIAFGVPQLWDGLYLSQSVLLKFNKIFGSAHKWLGRAKNRPLSFRLRWATVTTWNSNPVSWITFPADICLQMHSLILELRGNCGTQGMMHIARQLEKAKALRRICLLRSWQLGFSYARFSIPWSQFTHLYISKTLNYHTEWKDILFTCVNLEQGMFEIEPPPHEIWSLATSPPGCLPHLREIAVETTFLENPNIFHGIELPALKALRISTRELPMWRLIISGVGPLKIQIQFIEVLSLISGVHSIPTGEMHRLLRDTPEVTELDLELSPPDIAKMLANSILRSPLRTYFLPQLQVIKLEMRHVRVYGFLYYLERFVRSRFEGTGTGVRLERVVLFCVEGQRVHLRDALEALKPLVDEGLKLEVKIMGTEEKIHWSTRLDPETVEWPEGLAVAGCSNQNVE